MKRYIFLAVLILLLTGLLTGCFIDATPAFDQQFLGEYKPFTKAGMTITLPDNFTEQESIYGFDAYYVANFAGVCVLKEEFTLEPGLADRPLEQYIKDVIANNGREIEPQFVDGLWFYEAYSGSSFIRSYCYKGTDAFYIVQFICQPDDRNTLADLFHTWALSVCLDEDML